MREKKRENGKAMCIIWQDILYRDLQQEKGAGVRMDEKQQLEPGIRLIGRAP